MSWDTVKEKKEIEGVGIAYIISKTDDWNRTEYEVKIKSKSHHVETLYHRHHLESWESYYAVPNGRTLNPPLRLPDVTFKSFAQKLCNNYNIKELRELLKLLENKRTKFSYPINRHNALSNIANDYFDYYKTVDRDSCIQDVIMAIEIYNDYPYNYEKFNALRKQAEEEQQDIVQEVLSASIEIF